MYIFAFTISHGFKHASARSSSSKSRSKLSQITCVSPKAETVTAEESKRITTMRRTCMWGEGKRKDGGSMSPYMSLFFRLNSDRSKCGTPGHPPLFLTLRRLQVQVALISFLPNLRIKTFFSAYLRYIFQSSQRLCASFLSIVGDSARGLESQAPMRALTTSSAMGTATSQSMSNVGAWIGGCASLVTRG